MSIKKWFLPLPNPTSKSPFIQGLQMSSLGEFNQLCETENLSFFLNASQKYGSQSSCDKDKFQNFLYNLSYLINSYEFDFFNKITNEFEEEIKSLANKHNININDFIFKSIKNITRLEYISTIFSNPFFPLSKWLLETISMKFEDQDIDDFLRNQIPLLSTNKHKEIIEGFIWADANSNYSSSNYFSSLFIFYIKELGISDLGIDKFEEKYGIKDLFNLLGSKSFIGMSSILFHYYSQRENFSLFTYNNTNDKLNLDSFINLIISNKHYTNPHYENISLNGENTLTEFKELMLSHIFENNSELPEYSNFQLFFKSSNSNISKIYQYLCRDNFNQWVPFDFYQNNPHKGISEASILWQEKTLFKSLLSKKIDSNDYIFELDKINKLDTNSLNFDNKEHFAFFNNFISFFNTAISHHPVNLQYLQAEHLDKILLTAVELVKSHNSTLPFFKQLFLSTVEFSTHYNISIKIPSLNNNDFEKLLPSMIELEENILKIIVPTKNENNKLLKF